MTETTTATTGECQVCGRVQKLVNGRLANHGYRRPGTGWGNTGTCPGSRWLPAPDVAALRCEIESYERHLANNEKDLAEFRTPGYVWHELAVPAKAIRAREEGIKNCRAAIVFYQKRIEELLNR